MSSKRQKTTHAAGGEEGSSPAAGASSAALLASPILPENFSPEVVEAKKGEYAKSEPYRHGVIAPLCDDARLRKVQEEMRTHLTATFKETDLFKVLQTGDLVTIDQVDPSMADKLPELLRLRAAIYSKVRGNEGWGGKGMRIGKHRR